MGPSQKAKDKLSTPLLKDKKEKKEKKDKKDKDSGDESDGASPKDAEDTGKSECLATLNAAIDAGQGADMEQMEKVWFDYLEKATSKAGGNVQRGLDGLENQIKELENMANTVANNQAAKRSLDTQKKIQKKKDAEEKEEKKRKKEEDE